MVVFRRGGRLAETDKRAMVTSARKEDPFLKTEQGVNSTPSYFQGEYTVGTPGWI